MMWSNRIFINYAMNGHNRKHIQRGTWIEIPRVSLASYGHHRMRPGLMLVVVLIMVVLLSLLAASYSFMVQAHLKTVIARTQQFQARMAAESGVEYAIGILRVRQGDLNAWHNNESELRSALVIGHEDEEASDKMKRRDDIRTYDKSAGFAFRFSLYAPDFDHPGEVRFGITDESARLDINVADEAQIRHLFEEVILPHEDSDHEVDIDVLVDSLLDWRSSGNTPRPNGAKDEYYGTLDPPYSCKSKDFSTVEELLLVRGFNAWVVYGEDYNQNGLLDPNEDDNDISFPPDNADGVLFRGISSYLTIWSREMNTAADHSPRINLNLLEPDKLKEKLDETELDSDIISYIMDVRRSGTTIDSVERLISESIWQEGDDSGEDPEKPSPDDPPSTQPSDPETTTKPDDEIPNSPGIESTDSYSDLLSGQPAPGEVDDLPLILDRLTVDPSPFTEYSGRINVSTAPREVLSTLEELSSEEVNAIVEARRELTSEEKSSPAWLLTEGVIKPHAFWMIKDKITTKSSVYRIESIGYADHIGVVERIMYVVRMFGAVPQVLYYRNMNELGTAYNPYGDEGRELKNRSD